jgi:hypothetical protein
MLKNFLNWRLKIFRLRAPIHHFSFTMREIVHIQAGQCGFVVCFVYLHGCVEVILNFFG